MRVGMISNLSDGETVALGRALFFDFLIGLFLCGCCVFSLAVFVWIIYRLLLFSLPLRRAERAIVS